MEDQDRKKRKRDSVWDHVGGEEGEGRCWCKHCPKNWNFSITLKVETIRLHFGVDKNGMRIPGQSGSCRNNPYAAGPPPTSPIAAHLVAAMSPALHKKFKAEVACFLYESGTPFIKVEHKRFNQSAKKS